MASKPQLVDLDMGSVARVVNLPAPVNPNDAARKADVDAVGGGGGATYNPVLGWAF